MQNLCKVFLFNFLEGGMEEMRVIRTSPTPRTPSPDTREVCFIRLATTCR